MFNVIYKNDEGLNFVYPCSDEKQRDHFVSVLTNAGIEYDVKETTAEMYYQICGCLFKSDGQIYTYVRPEGDAKPGMSAAVVVMDSYGHESTKEVVIVDTRKASVSEIRAIAQRLGRDKLGRIERVWQRKIA